MSTRILVDIQEHRYPALIRAGIREARSLRIRIQFAVYHAATKTVRYHEGWIDTGSPYSLLPSWVWEDLEPMVWVSGVPAPTLTGDIEADFASIGMAFTDERRISTAWMSVNAFCCHVDHMVPLIGMDALSGSLFACDLLTGRGFVEFRRG